MVHENTAEAEQNIQLPLPERLRCVDIAHDLDGIIKVILESTSPSDEQRVAACHVAKQTSADYTRTSTGLWPSGTTEADMQMGNTAGQSIGVEMVLTPRPLGEGLKMPGGGANLLGIRTSITILADAARRVD